MSQAFVKDGDGEFLEDIAPSLNALMAFLSRENNGFRVFEKRNFINTEGKQVFEMSNGMHYTKNDSGRWMVVI